MLCFGIGGSILLGCGGGLMGWLGGGRRLVLLRERRASGMGAADIFLLVGARSCIDDLDKTESRDRVGTRLIRLTVKASSNSLLLTFIILGSSGVMRLRPRYRVMKSSHLASN